jgi:nucleoside-diphosphate-sugar epimerase
LLDKEQVKIFFDYQGIFDIVIHCAGEGGSRLKLDSE